MFRHFMSSAGSYIIIRPIVTYEAETWTMKKKEEQALIIFKRKIFRRIYESVEIINKMQPCNRIYYSNVY
jgi:isocitrate dehydrogenase